MTEQARFGVVALVGLLVGVLAAVMTAGSGGGSGSGPSGTIDLIAHSADVAATQGSARAEFTMSMSFAGTTAMSMSGDAAFDFDAQAFSMSMRADGSELGGFDTEMRLVGTTAYMRLPVAAGAPTPWIAVDLGAVGGEALASLGNGTDITQTLAYLRGAGDVTAVGRDTIRGVATTHYRAHVDLERAAGEVPSGQRDQVEAAIEQLEAMTGASSFPVDVWIDDAGLPRRMSYAITIAGDKVPDAPAAGDLSMSFSMDVFDYGHPVSVVPPPPGEVTDMTASLDQFA